VALDALGHLMVSDPVAGNGAVREYDATTGATVNANFITGLTGPEGLGLDGNNHLFVTNSNFGVNTVGEYDATTGATINAAFISSQGLAGPVDVVFMTAPEPSSLLLVAAAAGLGVAIRRRERRARRSSAGSDKDGR
jgi:hypothetical protein